MSAETFQMYLNHQVYLRDISPEYRRNLNWHNWADWAKRDYVEKNYVEFFEYFFLGK